VGLRRMFTDRISNLGGKDAAMEIAGVWLVEMSELDALTKASNSAIKSFVSRRSDRFRPPYGSTWLITLDSVSSRAQSIPLKATSTTQRVPAGSGQCGALVVAPSTLSESTNNRRFVPGRALGEIEIAQVPRWLIKLDAAASGVVTGNLAQGAIDIAATAPTGRQWPGGAANGRAGDVIILSAEDAHRQQQEVEGEVRRTERDRAASEERVSSKDPGAPPSPSASASEDSLSESTLTQASRIVAKPIHWLWHKRIFLAAMVTTAGELPCCEGRAPLGSVVVMVNEDDIERTVVPRLKAAGADLSKTYVVGGEGGFDLNDLTGVKQHIRQRGDVRLLIVDAIDVNPTANVRKMLRPLQTLATKFKIAVVLVGHLTKNQGVSPLMQVRGPVGLVAVARTVSLVAAKDGRFLFMQVKNNLAPTGPALGYRSETRLVGDIEAAAAVWEPQPVAVTVEDLAKHRRARHCGSVAACGTRAGRRSIAAHRCAQFIRRSRPRRTVL
jgi:hypothetical protein